MKTLLLLLISISCLGQTKYFGKTFVATIKESNTGLLVVCYPGRGEAFGTADGSRLSTINYGFDESKQWPFTIMKVQTIGTNNFVAWAEIQRYIDDHSTAAIVIGWSQGGKEVMDLLLGFQGRTLTSKVKLAVSIDGPASGSPDYTKASVPLIIISGKNGEFYYPLRTQERALLEQKKQVTFIEKDSLNHINLMKYAYSSSRILGAIKSMSPTPMSETYPHPVRVDSMAILMDTLLIYSKGAVQKRLLPKP
jgi:hypothetical protein